MTRCFSVASMTVAVVALAAGCRTVPNPPPPQTDCGDDDPRIGQTAVLNNHIHGIAGTARIVDNCTIVVESFSYDGIGIDVRFIGVKDGDFYDGTVLTEDIRREGGYQNETFTITLPEGVTLDDVPTLSVNCVSFGVSFGEGTFE